MRCECDGRTGLGCLWISEVGCHIHSETKRDLFSTGCLFQSVKWPLSFCLVCVCARMHVSVFIFLVAVLVMLIAVYYVLKKDVIRNKNDFLQKAGIGAWILVQKKVENGGGGREWERERGRKGGQN